MVEERGGRPGSGGKRRGEPARGGAGRGKSRQPDKTPRKAPEKATRDSTARGRASAEDRRKQEEHKRKTRSWGNVARRGARQVEDPGGKRQVPERGAPTRDPQEVWIDEGVVDAVDHRPPPRRARKPKQVLPDDVRAELSGAGSKLEQRLADALRAYERDRYPEAKRILKQIAEAVPTSAAARELFGLTLYRLGDWKGALRELAAYRDLTGSLDQHPVIADCHRALGHHDEVRELWEEIRHASPEPEVLAEGRIVMAAAMADEGDLEGAISLLAQAERSLKRPKLHNLRQWYALGDVYERAGDVPRARALFRRIQEHDPDFVDVTSRLKALR